MPKLLIVQNGDFREAVRRLDANGTETFHDQRKSVDYVRSLTRDWQVHVASPSDGATCETLAPGLEASSWPGGVWAPKLGAELVARHAPDAVLARLPNTGLIRAAGRRGVPCFPCFADVYRPVALLSLASRDELRHLRSILRLNRALAFPSVVGCGNHGMAAARSLHEAVGLSLSRCIPWEWSMLDLPPRRPERSLGMVPTVVFAGRLLAEKGVLDLIEALGALARRGVAARLVVAGSGPARGAAERLAERLGVAGQVELRGTVPKAEVRRLMQSADAVVAPTWHAYAEGLPNTVVEGLALGTPVVAVTNNPFLAKELLICDSVLLLFSGNPRGLQALSDILYGSAEPSGHWPLTNYAKPAP